MKTILAIDPGLSGGVAVSRFGKTECWPMPETEGDRLALVREIRAAALAEGGELVCVLEEVSGFAGKAQPGSAMFRFGEHFGFIKGAIQALEVRLVLVRPQVWQKGFGLGTEAQDHRLPNTDHQTSLGQIDRGIHGPGDLAGDSEIARLEEQHQRLPGTIGL